MRSIKSQMLADMAALLRLQDRFPARSGGPGAAAAFAAAPAAADSQQGKQHQQQQQHEGRSRSSSGKLSRNRVNSQDDLAAVNPLVLQAASGRYFADKPQVLQLVREAEQKLQAAVAACPSLQQVQQQMRGALPTEQPLRQAQQQEGAPHHMNCSATQDGSISAGRQNASSSTDSHVAGAKSIRSQLQQQFETGQDDSFVVQRQLLELEAELQSAGGWQSLMPHMLGCIQRGDEEQSSADAAVQRFWRQRFGPL
jgi:hypothetical protein